MRVIQLYVLSSLAAFIGSHRSNLLAAHVGGKLKVDFGKVKLLRAACAPDLLDCILTVLAEFGVDGSKWFGFGSDGASVMTGPSNGVAALARNSVNPYMLNFHCAAHRVALSSGVLRDIPCFKELESVVAALYAYMARSPKRCNSLKFYQHACGLPQLKVLQAHEVGLPLCLLMAQLLTGSFCRSDG